MIYYPYLGIVFLYWIVYFCVVKRELRINVERLIASLTLVLISMLIINNSIFLHSHHLSNGFSISHAHPFKKSQSQGEPMGHSHSKAEVLFLDQLNILFVIAISVSVAFYLRSNVAKFQPLVFSLQINYFTKFFGRAPPY